MQAQKYYDYGTSPRKYDGQNFDEEKKAKVNKGKKRISNRSQAHIFSAVFGIALCFVMVLSVTAYTAQAKYKINEKSKQVGVLKTEIDSLYLEVERQSTVENIEKRAMTELGMVYPTMEQTVVLENTYTNVADAAN